jgi:N-acetylmuramoyl-L-alanine amidase
VDSATGTRESDLNLAQALTLKESLLKLGYNVVFTRTADIFVPLTERIAMARRMRAQLFVSVHHDTPTARRAGVYYSPKPGSEDFAKSVSLALGPDAWVSPSSTSRFGRLYIDDFPGPAILIEFGPTRPVSREERIARAAVVASPIASFGKQYLV